MTGGPFVKLGQQYARIPDVLQRPEARKHASTERQGLTTNKSQQDAAQLSKANMEKWKELFEKPTSPSIGGFKQEDNSGSRTSRCMSAMSSRLETEITASRDRSAPRVIETQEDLKTAQGYAFRRQEFVREAVQKVSAHDKTVKQRKTSIRIQKNVVSKPKVFDT